MLGIEVGPAFSRVQEETELANVRTADGRTLTEAAEVQAFLAGQGIEYSSWGTERVPAGTSAKTLSAEEKEKILALYKPEIDALIAKNGYLTSDMVSLSPDTPNLEGMLDVFRKEHYHTDDEVRFTVAGRGIFFIRGKDGKVFECEVHAGDLIVVPENTWHWFDLCEDKQIACARIFKTKEGWVANFKDDPATAAAR